jgi:hypothetical protein
MLRPRDRSHTAKLRALRAESGQDICLTRLRLWLRKVIFENRGCPPPQPPPCTTTKPQRWQSASRLKINRGSGILAVAMLFAQLGVETIRGLFPWRSGIPFCRY